MGLFEALSSAPISTFSPVYVITNCFSYETISSFRLFPNRKYGAYYIHANWMEWW